MNRMLSTLLTAALLVPGAGALTGCASDDAVRKDAKEAGRNLDDAAGKTDEKVGDAAEDAVDAVDDDDGK
jgi:hypothetical protein